MESDVLVVGYGSAGSTAAVTAHDSGASVVILEKMHHGGGNSRVSGANIRIANKMEFIQYLEKLNFGMTDSEIIKTFVQGTMKNGDWIKEIGGDVEPAVALEMAYPQGLGAITFRHVPGADGAPRYRIKGTEKDGRASLRLWKLLSGLVEKRGIKVMTSTPAKEIIRSENGEVLGVMAENEGKHIFVKAKQAVILTCGGFENDPNLKWDYIPSKPVKFLGNPGNTGDGIRMVQKIGADIWHMTSTSCTIGFQAPDFEAAFMVRFLSPRFIFTDKYGKRFVNEAGIDTHDFDRYLSYFDIERMEFPRLPMWAIFDENTRRMGPIMGNTCGYNLDIYEWSADNSKEIAKGWVIQGKSIAELAGKMSLEASILEDTVNRYNGYCKTGRDADFGRAKQHLGALERPFYAIQLWPTLINTQGGPRRDKESRVLDPYGKPIPRLYAAGELGSIWGYVYPGGVNVAECLVFGRIAGKNAAAEKRWS